jgi:hypothetical protein
VAGVRRQPACRALSYAERPRLDAERRKMTQDNDSWGQIERSRATDSSLRNSLDGSLSGCSILVVALLALVVAVVVAA